MQTFSETLRFFPLLLFLVQQSQVCHYCHLAIKVTSMTKTHQIIQKIHFLLLLQRILKSPIYRTSGKWGIYYF